MVFREQDANRVKGDRRMTFIGVLANSEASRALKRIWYLQYFLQALENRDNNRIKNSSSVISCTLAFFILPFF